MNAPLELIVSRATWAVCKARPAPQVSKHSATRAKRPPTGATAPARR